MLVRLCRGAFWIFLPLTLSATDGNERLERSTADTCQWRRKPSWRISPTFTRRLHNAIDDLLDMHDSQGES